MAYCDNCGNQLLDSAKFCTNCGQQVSKKDSKKTEPKWSFDNFLKENRPNERGVVLCPYCMGKGEIIIEDINRLSISLNTGNCQLCDGIGQVNVKKIIEFENKNKETVVRNNTINIDDRNSEQILVVNKNINSETKKFSKTFWIMVGIYIISISMSFIISISSPSIDQNDNNLNQELYNNQNNSSQYDNNSDNINATVDPNMTDTFTVQ